MRPPQEGIARERAQREGKGREGEEVGRLNENQEQEQEVGVVGRWKLVAGKGGTRQHAFGKGFAPPSAVAEPTPG